MGKLIPLSHICKFLPLLRPSLVTLLEDWNLPNLLPSTHTLKILFQPGVVVPTCNPSTREAEGGGPQIQDQPGLHKKILSQNKMKKCISAPEEFASVYITV
jgi:hypothetical protein